MIDVESSPRERFLRIMSAGAQAILDAPGSPYWIEFVKVSWPQHVAVGWPRRTASCAGMERIGRDRLRRQLVARGHRTRGRSFADRMAWRTPRSESRYPPPSGAPAAMGFDSPSLLCRSGEWQDHLRMLTRWRVCLRRSELQQSTGWWPRLNFDPHRGQGLASRQCSTDSDDQNEGCRYD